MSAIHRITLTTLRDRIWESPTITTWASILLRSLGAVISLPVLLRRLTPEEVSIWYLLATIASLNSLIDLGFNPSFTRSVAYATAQNTKTQLATLYATMRYVYLRMALGSAFLMAIWGTCTLIRPIGLLNSPSHGWIAWIATLLLSPTTIYSNLYLSFLQGSGHVALIRRWDALLNLCAIASNVTTLLLGGGLAGVVLSAQVWNVISTFRCHILLIRLFPKATYDTPCSHTEISDTLKSIWPSTWRFGIGTMVYNGALQASGLLYAQIGEPKRVATYLFSSQLLNILRTTAQAPFYSRIPALSAMWAAKRGEELKMAAARGMRLSYSTFTVGFFSIGCLADIALSTIKSKTTFAEPALWTLMGIGAFLERYGGMHQNMVAIANSVASHTAGIGFLLIFGITLQASYHSVGIYAFPIAMIVAHLTFFSWYSAKHSYQRHSLTFWSFDRIVFLPNAILMATACLVYNLLR